MGRRLPQRSVDRPAARTRAFSLEVQRDREAVRVVPRGELDILTADRVRSRVADLLEAGFSTIVIDLRELAFMDSTGLRLLLVLHQRARRDGWSLSLTPGPEPVQRVFELTGTSAVLPFTADGGPPPR